MTEVVPTEEEEEEEQYSRLQGFRGQNMEGQGGYGALGLHLPSTESRIKSHMNVYPAG